MAIRKVSDEKEDARYEKDVFATDVDGKVTAVVVQKEQFTISERKQRIDLFQSKIDALQADIDAAIKSDKLNV